MSFITNTLLGGALFEPIRKGLKSATGLTDAQLGGAAALAAGGALAAPALLAPAAGASAPESAGLLGTMGKVAGAGATGLSVANQVNGMMKSQPMQAGQLQPRQGPDFSGLLAAQTQQQQAMSQEQQLRKQQQQAAIQGLLNGGAYGRVA